MPEPRIAIVTPSFARDFELARELNESILRYASPAFRHYLIVDRDDVALFRPLAGQRTVVAAVEDVVPRGIFRVPFSHKWWFARAAMVPAKGWLVQQLVKIACAWFVEEAVTVNVDSDVLFVRDIDSSLFVRDAKTRLYRQPGGVVAGMTHVKWNRNVARMLGVEAEVPPMADYVGNLISWDRALIRQTCARIEQVTGLPWHAAFARARNVSEYFSYGYFVEKVLGFEHAPVWIDERSPCHTYWGPGPLTTAGLEDFVTSMKPDDVAFSIGGYTGTPAEIRRAAVQLARTNAERREAL